MFAGEHWENISFCCSKPCGWFVCFKILLRCQRSQYFVQLFIVVNRCEREMRNEKEKGERDDENRGYVWHKVEHDSLQKQAKMF